MSQIETLQRRIDDLRFRGFGGTAIQLHRAIYQIRLNKGELLFSLFLPLIFNILLLYALGPLLRLWQIIFEFWISKIGPGGTVPFQTIDVGRYEVLVPYPALAASAPSSTMWWGTLIVCLVLLVGSYLFKAKASLS